jgi:hypothetical protein
VRVSKAKVALLFCVLCYPPVNGVTRKIFNVLSICS